MRKLILSSILLIFPAVSLFAQKQGASGFSIWETTMDAGIYFANRYTAGYYNGATSNDNNLSYILDNPYHRQDISNHLGVLDTFYVHGLPEKMRYDPGVFIGLGASRYLQNNITLDFRVGYSRLTATDVFTLEIDPGTVLGPVRTQYCTIWGREERFTIDIGLRKFIPLNDYISGFLGGGFNFNNTKVLESKIKIADLEYSLVNIYLNQNYIPGASQMEYDIQQGGIGYGGYATTGLRYRITDNFALETTLLLYQKNIHLDGYLRHKSHFGAFLRLCFGVVHEETLP